MFTPSLTWHRADLFFTPLAAIWSRASRVQTGLARRRTVVSLGLTSNSHHEAVAQYTSLEPGTRELLLRPMPHWLLPSAQQSACAPVVFLSLYCSVFRTLGPAQHSRLQRGSGSTVHVLPFAGCSEPSISIPLGGGGGGEAEAVKVAARRPLLSGCADSAAARLANAPKNRIAKAVAAAGQPLLWPGRLRRRLAAAAAAPCYFGRSGGSQPSAESLALPVPPPPSPPPLFPPSPLLQMTLEAAEEGWRRVMSNTAGLRVGCATYFSAAAATTSRSRRSRSLPAGIRLAPASAADCRHAPSAPTAPPPLSPIPMPLVLDLPHAG